MAYQENVKWIVPPGLVSAVKQFEKHCTIAIKAQMPILIYGSTGSGKSLFLRIYEDIYKNKYGQNTKVTRFNCSHFAGSDPRIAQTELFGIVKGSASGVNRDRKGMVSVAHGGLLILDEIGELPPEVQAMLLTYIETGKFRKLGGTEEETSTAFIAGATNRPEELRRDFYQRFFPFQLQPLHKRRGDVLYYFSCLYPELVRRLTPWEVLSLLAYHWPGNIREVDRMGLLLIRNREKEFRRPLTDEDPNIVERIDLVLNRKWEKELSRKSTEPNIVEAIADYVDGVMQSIEFSSALDDLEEKIQERDYSWLPTQGDAIDKKQIDRILKPYFISPDPGNTWHPFARFQHELLNFKPEDTTNIQTLKSYEPFERAYIGYKIFCALFMQDDKQNSNTIYMHRFTPVLPNLSSPELRTLKKLTKSMGLTIIKALANLGDNEVDNRIKEVPLDQERQGFFQALYERNPENPFLQALLGVEKNIEPQAEELNLSGYKRDDLLRSFYSQILRKTRGVEKTAATLIGMPYTSFRDELRKLGVKKKKSTVNTNIVL